MRRFLVILGIVFLSSCEDQERQARECLEVKYENGVSYFPCNEEAFLLALSRQRQGRTVEAIAGDGTRVYGSDGGYIVVFQK